jgi:hypothetical protein
VGGDLCVLCESCLGFNKKLILDLSFMSCCFAPFYCARSAWFNLIVLNFSSVFFVGKLCFNKILLVCSSLVALVDFTPTELWPR